MLKVELLENVTVSISTIGERMMLVWILLHHDYDDVKIGTTRIQSKWHPCEDGQYYKDGQHGKYLYGVTYRNSDMNYVELKDIELDVDSIMEQINNAVYDWDFDNFEDYNILTGARYNYKDANLDIYTDKKVTKVSCSLNNPLCSQDSLNIYFECNEDGDTVVLPVVAFHSNVAYANIKYMGQDEMTDVQVFHLESKADPEHVIVLEFYPEDLLEDITAYRMKNANGTLVHEN